MLIVAAHTAAQFLGTGLEHSAAVAGTELFCCPSTQAACMGMPVTQAAKGSTVSSHESS